jgi:hypothetical protein
VILTGGSERLRKRLKTEKLKKGDELTSRRTINEARMKRNDKKYD